MADRSHDWLNQGERDLRHARHALEDADFEWACFAAQQAAEKAVKGLVIHLGGEPWGHSVSALMAQLPPHCAAATELVECAKMLDKHYIQTLYPNGFDSGAPGDYYTRREAEEAIANAEAILVFCRNHMG